MYNLAHMYIYENIKYEDEEPIKLLIKSAKQDFIESKKLLCIILIKKYEYNLNLIKKELKKQLDISKDDIKSIIEMIQNSKLKDPSIIENEYKHYKDIVYLYNIYKESIEIKYLYQTNKNKENKLMKNITNDFYEGFGKDIFN